MFSPLFGVSAAPSAPLTLAQLTALLDGTYSPFPWNHLITPLMLPSSNVGFGAVTQDNSAWLASYRTSNGAQNNLIGWKLPIAAGTYNVSLFGWRNPSKGIGTLSIAGTDLTTFDAYAAGNAVWQSSQAGLVVAASGIQEVRLTIATKNAASSGYDFEIDAMTLTRTA